ncbi:MAG TPA: orotate phosphoribosyltransferase [Balneolales bacterium]|nr:orotate phosphoribosyltransferase [Balneolales bacterium]
MKIIEKQYAEELALKLLEIGAVILRPNDPFVWSSGWNSPIYCDNRLTLNHPLIREKIADHFVTHIREKIPKVDVITGTATAGIPHAAWVADRLNKPMAYVRAKAKAYGMGNQIEGGVKKGQTTVIIEDLISTGSSVLSVADVLNFIGADVLQILTIFTYSFDIANKKLEDHNIDAYCLTDYPTLIEVAQKNGYVDEKDIQLLNEWRQNPDTWPKK